MLTMSQIPAKCIIRFTVSSKIPCTNRFRGWPGKSDVDCNILLFCRLGTYCELIRQFLNTGNRFANITSRPKFISFKGCDKHQTRKRHQAAMRAWAEYEERKRMDKGVDRLITKADPEHQMWLYVVFQVIHSSTLPFRSIFIGSCLDDRFDAFHVNLCYHRSCISIKLHAYRF